MNKLKLHLEQIENTVVMRILEQEGIWNTLLKHINTDVGAILYRNGSIGLRGEFINYGDYAKIEFESIEEATRMLKVYIRNLDAVFYKNKPFIAGKKVYVEKYNDYRILSGAYFGDYQDKYYVVMQGDEEKFYKGEDYQFESLPVDQIIDGVNGGYNLESKTYYGEVEL